jgi:hypothetical protein
MPKKAATKPFATEAAMCADFIAALPADWVSYNETAGWDLLLVRKPDGFQIGVQAKLRFNPEVIAQAIDKDSWYHRAHVGPDCRAVLVPTVNPALAAIARHLLITPIIVIPPAERIPYDAVFRPALPRIKGGDSWARIGDWEDLCPDERHQLPEYVPDVVAGASAPVQLSVWKIKALKIAVILETRGYVTRADFKALSIDAGRWCNFWLRRGERFTEWVAGPDMPDFKKQHPLVYAQIFAERAKWMPPAPPRKETQIELPGVGA